jgi:hypothetical protein
MKRRCMIAVLIGMILLPCTAIAQAPAGAPPGTTGKCKDGTFTTALKKQGACRGHKGVEAWYASEAPTPAKSPAAAPVATPAPTPTTSSAPAPAESVSAKARAEGGGPGLVWVNTASNVYHCYGTRYYGTTKAGKYVSEADAKAAGARPAHGKPCSQ